MNQTHAHIYVNTNYIVPGAEVAAGIRPDTGWQPSTLYTAENTPADIFTSLELPEFVSDLVGDMYTYYNNRFIVMSDQLSDDSNHMNAIIIAGIHPDTKRIEPLYIVLSDEWNDIQMLIEHEFLGMFR